MPTGVYDHKNQEENHPFWKGGKVGYGRLHAWVRQKLGNLKKCSHCLTEKAPKYEFANISGQYKRDLRDWLVLCVPCHKTFDNQCGENIHTAKLKESDIPNIFSLKSRGHTGKQIAQKYNVEPSTISCVLLRKSWKHLTIGD